MTAFIIDWFHYWLTFIIFRFNLKTEAGRSKGLTLMLDGHSDLIAESSIPDDFQGFMAVIGTSTQYPLTTRKSLLIRPGHSVSVGGNYQIVKSDLNIFFLFKSLPRVCAVSSKRWLGSTLFFSVNRYLHNLAFTNLSLNHPLECWRPG
jgi:hypothetical protein